MKEEDPRATKRQKVEHNEEDVLPHFSSPFYSKSNDGKRIAKSLLPKLVELQRANSSYEVNSDTSKSVVHIFTRDFRIKDNTSLYEASKAAAELKKPLVCVYVDYPELDKAHSVSGWQREYRKQSLLKLQKVLENEYEVPLYFASCKDTNKHKVVEHIVSVLKELETTVVFSNILYEIDEFQLCLEMLKKLPKHGISFQPIHDVCVIAPTFIRTQKDSPYSIFTPWYKNWLKHLDENKEEILKEIEFEKPSENKKSDPFLKKFFSSKYEEDSSKESADYKQQRANFKKYWTAGEESAFEELHAFLKSDKITGYAQNRNENVEPIQTSQLSPHIASGTLSVRSILRILQSETPNLFHLGLKQHEGKSSWVRQLAWKDFYAHILCHWPYICTFAPFQTDFSSIEWEYNKDHFTRWCKGTTGYPFVDAAMRQLNKTGYIPNRCRMVVASFLVKHLLIDWRYGERYFSEHLVDGDFASNNGGWGFSSSVGVDPQPYFRVFNPWTQSEKFDTDGKYIKKWVPELIHITGKAIHNPYATQDDVKGYPRPIVDHKEARERALERYKQAKYN